MVKIYFGDLQVDRISNNSGLFTGENKQYKWGSHLKINEGFGRLSGKKNRAQWNQSILFDRDFIDMIRKKKL